MNARGTVKSVAIVVTKAREPWVMEFGKSEEIGEPFYNPTH